MAKAKVPQRHVFKISSKRLRRANWDLKLNLSEAFENDELIAISDSQIMRFIYSLNNRCLKGEIDQIKNIRISINKLKKESTSVKLKNEIRKQYDLLHNLLFVEDYVTIKFETIKDFNRACKGFFINNKEFKRMVGTPGGIKSNTIVFVSKDKYDRLNEMITNNANPVEIIPAKLEAYRSLCFSSSTPVLNTRKVVVVKDWETQFYSNVTKVGEDKNGNLFVKDLENQLMTLEDSDGYGAISPELSKKWSECLGEDYIPSGFIIRNSYCKGSLFTFDIKDFSEKIAKKKVIFDVWGKEHNVDDIDIVMPVSMMKMWNAYDSIDHYFNSCEQYGYTFSVTKIIPKELENFRNLNYQFLQSLRLNDDDLYKLLKPTIDEFHDVLGDDYRKTLVFLRGSELNESNAWMNNDYNFTKALMIDSRMNNDPFVRSHVYKMIKKRIQDAKTGVVKVRGCFQIVSGDIFGFMESAFDLENPTGLLKSNEFYSNYWNIRDVDKVSGFRAPMTVHENIKIMNLKNNCNMSYWYQYMPNVLIFNAWDCSAHTLNGLDKDGDSVMTTDSEIILSGIEEGFPIVCMQNSAKKVIPTQKMLEESNKNGFGEKIGLYTNRATTMEQMKVKFDKESNEYKELEKRIKLCMHFQQAEIDKIKGVKSPPMPKEWYDYKINQPNDEDSEEDKLRKEFNLRILADKKPKFMIYIYSDLMKRYNDYKKSVRSHSLAEFKMTPDELKMKVEKSESELSFLGNIEKYSPVEGCNSLMNKVCDIFEKEFDQIVKRKNKTIPFDYSFLIPDVNVSSSRIKKIEHVYKEYSKKINNHMYLKSSVDNEETSNTRNIMVSDFKSKCFSICNNEKELLAILIKILYKTNKSKQFLWDIVGEALIKNLLEQNGYKIFYPEKNEDDPEFVYNYQGFRMKTIEMMESEFVDN